MKRAVHVHVFQPPGYDRVHVSAIWHANKRLYPISDATCCMIRCSASTMNKQCCTQGFNKVYRDSRTTNSK